MHLQIGAWLASTQTKRFDQYDETTVSLKSKLKKNLTEARTAWTAAMETRPNSSCPYSALGRSMRESGGAGYSGGFSRISKAACLKMSLFFRFRLLEVC